MNVGPLLIVLRGNSASGKTTTAASLQRALGPGTANIGQDNLRRVMLREHDVADGDNIGLIANIIRYCASLDYHVIVEGILGTSHYRDMLCQVVAEHPGPTHVFYLDVPVEVAMQRYQQTPLALDVSPERFRSWYTPLDLLGLRDEVVVDATAEPDSLVSTIVSALGDVSSASRDPTRYL